MGIHKRGRFFYASFQIDGKQYLRSTKTTNKNQALAFERKFRNEVYSEIYLGDKKIQLLHEAIDNFLKSKIGTKDHHGLISKTNVTKKYFDKNMMIHELTTAEVEQLVFKRRDEGKATQTIKQSIHVLRGAYKLANKYGYRVREIEWPSFKAEPARIKWLTLEQEQQLLEELHPDKIMGPKPMQNPKNWPKKRYQDRLNNWHYAQALLGLGCRSGELNVLQWKDVDLEEGKIYLYRSKTENASVLYFTDKLLEIFKERYKNRNGSEYVFTDSKGGPRKNQNRAIINALKRIGLNMRCHDLRHSLASRLVQSGELTIPEIQSILGHKHYGTTLKYAHLAPEQGAKKMKKVLDEANRQMKPELKVVN